MSLVIRLYVQEMLLRVGGGEGWESDRGGGEGGGGEAWGEEVTNSWLVCTRLSFCLTQLCLLQLTRTILDVFHAEKGEGNDCVMRPPTFLPGMMILQIWVREKLGNSLVIVKLNPCVFMKFDTSQRCGPRIGGYLVKRYRCLFCILQNGKARGDKKPWLPVVP